MGIPKGKRISFVKVDSGYNHVKVCSDDLQDGYMLDEQECIFGCYRGSDFLGRYLEEFLDDLNADNACFLLNLLSDELSSDVRFSGWLRRRIDSIDEDVGVQESLIFHESRLGSKCAFLLLRGFVCRALPGLLWRIRV